MKRLAPILLLAACNGNSTPHGEIVDAPPRSPDARSVDGGSGGASTMITMNTYGSIPTFAAYRDGTKAWAMATLSDDVDYTFTVTSEAFEFVAVCTGSDGTLDETEVAATVSDGTQQGFYCVSPDDDMPQAGVAVSGMMAQPGTVQMADTKTGATSPWSFTLSVPPSTQDLVAISATHMFIQRGLTITDAETLPATIDADGSGMPLANESITIPALSNGEAVTSTVYLATANDFATISTGTSATSLTLAPSALLDPNNDSEFADVEATTATTDRYVETYDATTTTEFDLLPVPTGITFSGTTASWTTPLTADTATQDLIAQVSATVTQSAAITASSSWLTATGATSLAFDATDAPSWQASWSFWTSATYTPMFTLEVDGQTGFQSSSLSGTSAFAAAARHRARRLHSPALTTHSARRLRMLRAVGRP